MVKDGLTIPENVSMTIKQFLVASLLLKSHWSIKLPYREGIIGVHEACDHLI